MKISVIIPVYNQETLILTALESVPKQQNIELVIVNDGSTDSTDLQINSYIEQNKNKQAIQYIRHDINKGLADTINSGLSAAIGDYIVILDSDDFFLTEDFKKIIPLLNGPDLVYFNLRLNDGSIWDMAEQNEAVLSGSVKFIKRDFIGDTRYDGNKRNDGDYDFYSKLSEKNPIEIFTTITIKHYNFLRDGSITQERLMRI